MNRTLNAARNIAFGGMLKIYQIALPFIMRTIMIHYLGISYVGLNGLFYSVLQMLNLTELGVGSAMVYCMYEPIAKNDTEKICALMYTYRLYYRIIGIVIAVIGLILTPYIPNLIHGTVPSDLNVFYLYLMNLATTVLSYWLFSYKNSILLACQRNDIKSKITIVIETIKYALQIIALCIFKNYYYFLTVFLLSQIILNITTSKIVDRKYPMYKASGKLKKDELKTINSRIKDVFTAKLGGVVMNSADPIVISSFLGLTILGIYQNYYIILNAVTGMIDIIIYSLLAGVGNSIITESKEKNFNDLKKLTLMFFWIIGCCACCLVGMYQPFMRIWLGDEYLLSMGLVIMLAIYFIFNELIRFISMFKDAAGIWHEDRLRPLVGAIVNLGLNILLVKECGLYGVLISTIISVGGIDLPWIINNIFKTIYRKEWLKKYIKNMLKYSFEIITSVIMVYMATKSITGNKLKVLIVNSIISVLIPNIILLLFNFNTLEFKQICALRRNLLKKVQKR